MFFSRFAWQLTRHRTAWLRPLYALEFLLPTKLLRKIAYALSRTLDGAERIQTGNYKETCGTFVARGVSINFSGACPIQGFGEIDGFPCYYRSRGEGWSICVAKYPESDPMDIDAFYYGESNWIWPEGGWAHAEVTRACIDKGLSEWDKWRRKNA